MKIRQIKEALAKAKKKKVIPEKFKAFQDDKFKEIEAYRCPNCGTLHLGFVKYCEECGQALEWSDI